MSPSTTLPRWQILWLICFSLFGILKAISIRPALTRSGPTRMTPSQALSYLFGWPGLDPTPFVSAASTRRIPTIRELGPALLELAIGSLLVWNVAPRVRPCGDLAEGWVGLVGFGFLLHFGLFRVLYWFWNRHGVPVQPIMDAPLRATSLEEFWGRRWNRAFRDFSHTWVFRPAVRIFGAFPAVAIVFLFSGLVHDAAISVPAGAGFGWPTAYFVTQFLGVCLQRTKLARTCGLDRGLLGWSLTALFLLGPVGWLFHPPFVRNVIVPFLHVLGAGHGD